jgi:ADP-dependent NAD(P)H-hydrate dehydratase / NAD(P)H-hydrate epimerase
MDELLTVAEMYRADQLAMADGVPGIVLMENAGRAVALEVMRRYDRAPVAVLCGPGNNGGDGFVAARHLARAGWPVRLGLLGTRDRLSGDAAEMARRWDGATEPLSPATLDDAAIVIDALFGAGLARPLGGVAKAMVEAVNARGSAVLAVDVPSGLHGDSGRPLGGAEKVIHATRTVTFFRRKPGHVLLPGRALCGETTVADIGIPPRVLDEIKPVRRVNGPRLWRTVLPRYGADSHKYTRGHAVVVGGGVSSTGAGRLAARAALRAGAGLVTLACPPEALVVNAAQLTAVMVAPIDSLDALRTMLADRRKNALLIGPGSGVNDAVRDATMAILGTGRPAVLDADALTVLAPAADALPNAVQGPSVLTPHDGEFARLFPDLVSEDKIGRTQAAAARSRCVVLLKGADTVIAAPDGRVAVNDNAPPWLGTAGAGDVLAGIILGLLAQRVPAFEAAAAGAWIHGAAATRFGPGLIAEDLTETLPAVLRQLLEA